MVPQWGLCGEKYSLSRFLPYLSLGVTGKEPLLQVPQHGPYGERCPFPDPCFTYLIAPLHGLPLGSIWREMFLFQSQWFIHQIIHSYISETPVKELSHEMGNPYGLCPRIPSHMEGLHTVGCSLVPLGDSVQQCCCYPHCQAAFSMILSTLAWVNQSPFSQCVL